MKASIKFRDEQKPLLRAKIPLNIMSFPFQSGISAGETKELSLNLSTSFDSGPSLKFSYRPNDPLNPFSLVFKTGIGHYGSPLDSPLTMSAQFNLVGTHQNPNPSFFIHFKPRFGDFSFKKSHSSLSSFANRFGGKTVNGFLDDGFLKGNGFLEAREMVAGMVKGTELSARTKVPVRDFALVDFRWGLRVPPAEIGADEVDAVVVGKRGSDGGVRLPLLVMNKIGIEHVANKGAEKKKGGGKYDEVVGACLELKKQLEVIQAENGLLSKALGELRADMAAGKMDVFAERKFGGAGGVERRGNGDKKGLEMKGYGGKMSVGEGNDGGKGV